MVNRLSTAQSCLMSARIPDSRVFRHVIRGIAQRAADDRSGHLNDIDKESLQVLRTGSRSVKVRVFMIRLATQVAFRGSKRPDIPY